MSYVTFLSYGKLQKMGRLFCLTVKQIGEGYYNLTCSRRLSDWFNDREGVGLVLVRRHSGVTRAAQGEAGKGGAISGRGGRATKVAGSMSQGVRVMHLAPILVRPLACVPCAYFL